MAKTLRKNIEIQDVLGRKFMSKSNHNLFNEETKSLRSDTLSLLVCTGKTNNTSNLLVCSYLGSRHGLQTVFNQVRGWIH